MAIASAKKTHWSDFLSSAPPQSLWTAKRFVFGLAPRMFQDLPRASDPAELGQTLLHVLFPPKPPNPQTPTSPASPPHTLRGL